MQFLCIRFSSKNALDIAAKIEDWPFLSTVDGPPVVSAAGGFLCVLSGKRLQLENRTYYFGGHVVIGGKAISSSAPDSLAADDLADLHDAMLGFGTEKTVASGIFTLVVICNDTGAVSVFTDPLSQYNVFTCEKGGLHAISNNVFLIEHLFSALKAPIKRSFEVAGFEACFSFGAGNRTGYDDIRLMPADTYSVIKPHAASIEYRAAGALKPPDMDKREAFGHAVSSLKASAAAIHDSFSGHDIVYDLTGGFDSRLVLAASRSAGIRSQNVFRSEFSPLYDRAIPDMMVEKLGLFYADFPENYNGEAVTQNDLAKRAVYRQQGQSTVYNFELGQYRLEGVCRIRGGVGEILRTMFSAAPNRTFGWRLRKAWQGMKGKTPRLEAYASSFLKNLFSDDYASLTSLRLVARAEKYAQYLEPDFMKEAFCTVESQLANLQNNGFSKGQLLNAYYLTDRSRRHFGFTSQMLNDVRPSFEPLASLSLWHLACSYDEGTRKNLQLLYELFQALDPEILDFPFPDKSLKGTTMPFVHFEKEPVITEPLPKRPIRSCPEVVLKDTLEQSSAEGVHEREMQNLKALLQELVCSLNSNHDVWQVLKRQSLMELCQSAEFDQAVLKDAQFFKRITYGMLWVLYEEDHVPISRIY